jgi:hypothetical protein
MGWRWIRASVRGTSHLRDNTECQDYGLCDVLADDALVAIASDGAGSAPHSAHGSRLACELMLSRLSDHLGAGGKVQELDAAFLTSWREQLLDAILELAREQGLPETPRLFACTLVGAVAQGSSCFFFQIGDGAIVVAKRDQPESYDWIFWPDQGELESTTYFVTDDDALSHFRSRLVEGEPIDEIAVFTDGLQRLALQLSERVAHKAFFAPLFAELRKCGPGASSSLSVDLERFLDSARINERTDDDKTLILISRPGEPACPPQEANRSAASLF